MIRLPSRRVLVSYLCSRNYSSNSGKKERKSCSNEENDNVNLDSCFVVKKMAQTGIISTIFIIGLNCHFNEYNLTKDSCGLLTSTTLKFSPFSLNRQLNCHRFILPSQKADSVNSIQQSTVKISTIFNHGTLCFLFRTIQN